LRDAPGSEGKLPLKTLGSRLKRKERKKRVQLKLDDGKTGKLTKGQGGDFKKKTDSPTRRRSWKGEKKFSTNGVGGGFGKHFLQWELRRQTPKQKKKPSLREKKRYAR